MPLVGENTDSVLRLPALMISQTDSTLKTAISKTPITTWTFAEGLIPETTSPAATHIQNTTMGAHSQLGAPSCEVRLSCTIRPSSSTISPASMIR